MSVALLSFALLAAQELSETTYEKIRAHVFPTKEERTFFELPWQPTLWDGLVEAGKSAKPILLYTMNGRPLGST